MKMAAPITSIKSDSVNHRVKPIHFKVRRMRLEDVPSVLDIWALNNLHEGTNTIQSFMVQDPEGFLVAAEINEQFDDVADDAQNINDPSVSNGDGSLMPKAVQVFFNDGNDDDDDVQKRSKSKHVHFRETRILGMCAGVFVHPTIAFIGLYSVRPELQGQGIGIAMWNRMMDHVGSLNAGLYAVPQYLTMYRDRAGFHNPDDRLLFIYESDSDCKLNVDILVPSIRDTKITKITAEWYKKTIDYDANVHGYLRRKLLPHVFTEPDTAAFLASDINGHEIYGYGCIRTNNIGKAMIGPLYADNDAVAELLMRYLFTSLSGPFQNGLLYMTLDSNPGGERIAEKLGLKKHEEIPRFFRQEPYENADWDRVYCIHSPNFSLL